MIGQTIGRYRIVSRLGVGAMGEVYRARDERLGRDVAIKVLPAEWLADSDRRARLDREARILASLNHVHIGSIYGVEEGGHVLALVLEIVEGPTLADRIAQRPLSVDDGLEVARQIADALDAAHERGIVHRDLKPANVKLTAAGHVKVLDFGLATTCGPLAADAGATRAATVSAPGMLVGTVAYMSPEQARGQALDKRTDIWAFGCVLFELLAGRPPFAGATPSDTLAAILEREPEWSVLPPATPVKVKRLLARCLAKDVRQRLRDIADARFLLDGDPEGTAPPTAGGGATRAFAAGLAVLTLLAGAAFGWYLRGSFLIAGPSVSQFLLDVRPADSLLGSNPLDRSPISGRMRPSRPAIALSPDGRILVFSGLREGDVRLYARALDRPEAVPIEGTEGADGPVFSPDGKSLAFWAAGAIRRVPIAGGTAVKMCDANQPYGIEWSGDDRVLYAQLSGIWRVPAAGGTPEQITRTMPRGGEARHLLPHLIPGGKALLFTVQPSVNDWEDTRVVVQPLPNGERRTLVERAADARYVPTGHLVYMRLGTLMASPFDAERLQVSGGEFDVTRDVMQSVNSTAPFALDSGAGQYVFSASGTMAFVAGGPQLDGQNELQWISRDGRAEPIPMPPPARAYFLPRISPDGRTIAVGTIGMRDQNLWKYDIAQRTLTRLTFEGRAEQAAWSPDGSRIAFASTLRGFQNAYVVRSDGGAPPEQVSSGSTSEFPGGWTPDGKTLVVGTGADVAVLPLDGTRTLRPVVSSRFSERMPSLSPNGRWLAYVSNETGRPEVYVQAFPEPAGKVSISNAGGSQPVWSRDGRTLFYLENRVKDGAQLVQMIEVDVAAGRAFAAGARRELFTLDADHYGNAVQGCSYDVSPDGRRFVFAREASPGTPPPREIQVLGNWFAELKQRGGR